MIRIYFAEREPIDLEANEIDFTAAGGVILRRVEFRRVPNPQNLSEYRMEASNPQLVRAFSRDSHWTEVENIELDQDGQVVDSIPLEATTTR
jgi:hypothetical protein